MKKDIQRIIVLFLCMTLLFGALSISAFASTEEDATGIAVYEEKQIVFDTRIQTVLVTVSEVEDGYRLSAVDYSYDSDAAQTRISWIPVAVLLPSDEAIPFVVEGEEYTLSLTGEELETVCVVYAASFFVSDGITPYDTLMRAYASATEGSEALARSKSQYEQALLDGEGTSELAYAYQTAQLSYEGELSSYKAAKRAYDAAYEGYRAYVQFLAADQQWKEYIEELALYEAELSVYNDYLKAVADYEAAAREHEKRSEEYEKAYKEMKYHLSLIDVAKKKMTDMKRTLHGAITGSVVQDMVLGEEGDIVAKIGSEELVEQAGDATRYLIYFFDGVKDREKVDLGYFDLETDEERYAFYITNYDGVAAAYLELFQALEGLYRINIVRAGIVSKGKLPQYLILLAQLHMAANLLNDGPIYDYEGKPFGESWTVNEKSAYEILGEDYTKYAVDTDSAHPLKDGYPVAPGEAPKPPKAVADPGQPPRVVIEPTPVPVVKYPGGEFTEPPLAENAIDVTDRAPEETDISSTLAETKNDSLSLNFSGVSLFFDEMTVSDMKEGGVVAVVPDFSENEYSVTFLDENGESADVPGETKVVVDLSEGSHNAKLSYFENGEKCYQSFALYDNKLTFYAKTGVVYRLRDEYSAYIAPNAMVTVSTDKRQAEVGERITLTAELLPGVRLEKILVTDAEGRELLLDENNSFAMSEGGVRILAVATYIKYKVTFTVAGRVLMSEDYTYGAMPVFPKAPTRADEGRLRYTFSHWSPQAAAVTEDTVYDAVFSVELLPEVEDGLSPRTVRLIIFGSIGAVLLLVLIPVGIYMVLRIRRKRG